MKKRVLFLSLTFLLRLLLLAEHNAVHWKRGVMGPGPWGRGRGVAWWGAWGGGSMEARVIPGG